MIPNISKTQSVLIFMGLIFFFANPAICGEIRLASLGNITFAEDGKYVIARQGNDETSQEIMVKIWGSSREPSFFHKGYYQIDDDEQKEYIIISRNPGTGPYYKLQIIDFENNGILTWSYDSYGKPKIEQKNILLGESKIVHGQYGPGETQIYKKYRYTKTGLVVENN